MLIATVKIDGLNSVSLRLMKMLYDIFLFLYPVTAKVLSIGNEKAANWVKGRKDIFEKIKTGIVYDKQITWVHCSSLGEFEQGKPLIEKLKLQFSNSRILLTFFSPSGYEVQKNYKGADWIFYLPIDSKANAKKFFDLVKPSLIFFIKYEFWFYYLNEAKQRKIPLLLASGNFRENQPFFKWYGGFYKKMLECFSCIFVQSKESLELLKSINITNAMVSGDTRFDRVLEIAEQFEHIDIIQKFCGNHPVVVAGSTWSEDDKELDHYANTRKHIRFIIAPHHTNKAKIEECLALYSNAVTLSQLQISNLKPGTVNTLIIDNIGMLSTLYYYATITFVGGGFGDDGVHNVLEAAVYGKPVLFGPVYEKYIEADGLVDSGGGFAVENALELEKKLDELFNDTILYKQACIASANYVKENAGATEKIIGYIQEKRLLTT